VKHGRISHAIPYGVSNRTIRNWAEQIIHGQMILWFQRELDRLNGCNCTWWTGDQMLVSMTCPVHKHVYEGGQ
jgi:hypothetical protein